jgi:hypothetical protein
VRQIMTLVCGGDACWRRDDEAHHNVLIDTAGVPARLAADGVQVTVASAFGGEQLPTGLPVLIGRRGVRAGGGVANPPARFERPLTVRGRAGDDGCVLATPGSSEDLRVRRNTSPA